MSAPPSHRFPQRLDKPLCGVETIDSRIKQPGSKVSVFVVGAQTDGLRYGRYADDADWQLSMRYAGRFPDRVAIMTCLGKEKDGR